MTTTLTLQPGAEPLAPRIVGLLLHAAGLMSLLVRARRNRSSVAMLREFDDHMLADLGITRNDVRDAFAAPLWRDPSGLLGSRARERRAGPRRSAYSSGSVVKSSG